MARSRSSLMKLDPRIREAVEAAIEDGRASIDDLVSLIRSYGAEASRSAVGRYAKSHEEGIAGHRALQDRAERLLRQVREKPDGDVSRLLGEMVKVAAYNSISKIGEVEDEEVSALELSRMARMIRDLASVDRIKAEADAKARKELADKTRPALDQIEAEAKSGRVSLEAIRRVREDIYGVRE